MKTYIFDWKRTLYDPDTHVLIDGAIELLNYLHQVSGTRLILVGKGSDDMHKEVVRLGVNDYFTDIKFQEGDKDTALFADFVDKFEPRKTIFIGDRTRSELAAGNSLGAVTIWVRQGKFSDELPESPVYVPTHTVSSIGDVLAVIKKNGAVAR